MRDVPRGGQPDGDGLIVLCVPDGRIHEVAANLRPGGVLLHCSGARDVEVLRPHRPAGSWHPLMTFPGPEVAIPDLDGVPAALAGDPEAVAAGAWLSATLGMRSFTIPGDRRLYHAAAVMAGNFATVLLGDAARVLAAAGVRESDAAAILVPLALQSLRNAAEVGPARALTGPVARGDQQTLDGHRAALTDAGLHDLLPMFDEMVKRAASWVVARTD